MGTIIDSTYKNIIFTPEGDNNTLCIMIEKKKLGPSFLKEEVKKSKVMNVSIIAGELSQTEFNDVINVLARSTNKPIMISFMPIMKDNEETVDAYVRYAYNYTNNDPRALKKFPDNIFINNALIESNEEIKKRTM